MPATSVRSLMVCPVVPDTHWTGLSQRMALFADALRQLGGLDTVVVASFDLDHARETAGGRTDVCVIDATGRADTQFQLLMGLADPAERLRQFRAYGRGSRHAPLSAQVLAEIGTLAGEQPYDLVHIGRLYLADSITLLPKRGAATLDLDEDDAAAWQLLATRQPADQAAWSRAEADAEDRLIQRRAPAFDRLFIAGPNDRQSLLSRHPGLPVEVVGNAAVFPDSVPRREGTPTILFVGSLGYAPNLEGIAWFLTEVWPQVQRRCGDAVRFRIVGRAIPPPIRALDGSDGIEIVPDVDDVTPHYADATLAVAPLFTGGGTRLKVIEAAAHLVPMVATTRAAAGLDFADEDSLWLADDSATFVDAICCALVDPAARARRAERAWLRARARHDHAPVKARLAQTFGSLLQSRQEGEA